MTKFVVKNNVESTVADDPLVQSATTLHVPTGEGSNFPSTFPFILTIWDSNTYPDPGNDPGMEIVKCTNRSNDTLTIVRAQENTSDMEHSQGEQVAMLITAGIISELSKNDSVITKTTNDSPYTTTLDDDTILCNAIDGPITINLPTAVGISGKKYVIKKIDSSTNDITIDPNSTETIDLETTLIISGQHDSYTIQSDNLNWRII